MKSDIAVNYKTVDEMTVEEIVDDILVNGFFNVDIYEFCSNEMTSEFYDDIIVILSETDGMPKEQRFDILLNTIREQLTSILNK